MRSEQGQLEKTIDKSELSKQNSQMKTCSLQKNFITMQTTRYASRTLPRPAPIIALVGVSISGMPGPPLGPSPLITTTFPWKMRNA